MKKTDFIAFIPARGGSKGIPLKNIHNFCGMPLIYWTLTAASETKGISHIFVSTDSPRIRDTVKSFAIPQVTVISRSAESAADTAPTEMVILEFAKDHYFENIVLLQATSPLIETSDIEKGINKFLATKADSLLSMTREKKFIWRANGKYACPVNYNPLQRPRRQEWNGFFVENGAFYITRRKALLSNKCRISGKIALYEMDSKKSIEIDEPSDWIAAEQHKREQLVKTAHRLSNLKDINLLITDVDGTLTDAGIYYSEKGEKVIKFNRQDGKGIELIRKLKIKVMFLTAENSEIVAHRAKKLNVDFLAMGIKNKMKYLEMFYKKMSGYSFNRTAYIGDDINDIGPLKAAAFSACPCNAFPEVRSIVRYVCVNSGGNGCVRELCNILREGRK